MAHVEDRFYTTGRDGKRHKTSRHPDNSGNPRARRWRVRYTGPDGKEHNRSFAKKTDAERFRSTTEADVLRGMWTDPSAGKVTLKEYGDRWLASRSIDETTRERLARQLRIHIYPGFDGMPLSILAQRPTAVQEWVRGLRNKVPGADEEPLAPGHVKSLLSTLSSILGAAVDDGLIPRNPCRSRSVKAPREVQKRIQPWSPERVAAVRAGLRDRYRAMADAGSGLGLRIGEVLGLSPDDINWLRGVVHVRRQVKIVGGQRCFAPPKGGKERDVPLPETVKLRLAAHLEQFPAAAVTLPWRKPGSKPETVALMFTTPSGEALYQYDFTRRVWGPARRAAGVPDGRENGFHALRHHFASELLAGGVDVRALAEYLGHHDPAFTLRVYTHLMPRMDDRMRQAIDRVLEAPDGPGTALEGGNRG